MSPTADGVIGEWNILERHINSLSQDQVLECLLIVRDKFQHVPHWKNHTNRREKVLLHIGSVKGAKGIDSARDFLKACCRADPHDECRQFLEVGDYVEVIHRIGKPSEVVKDGSKRLR